MNSNLKIILDATPNKQAIPFACAQAFKSNPFFGAQVIHEAGISPGDLFEMDLGEDGSHYLQKSSFFAILYSLAFRDVAAFWLLEAMLAQIHSADEVHGYIDGQALNLLEVTAFLRKSHDSRFPSAIYDLRHLDASIESRHCSSVARDAAQEIFQRQLSNYSLLQ